MTIVHGQRVSDVAIVIRCTVEENRNKYAPIKCILRPSKRGITNEYASPKLRNFKRGSHFINYS